MFLKVHATLRDEFSIFTSSGRTSSRIYGVAKSRGSSCDLRVSLVKMSLARCRERRKVRSANEIIRQNCEIGVWRLLD